MYHDAANRRNYAPDALGYPIANTDAAVKHALERIFDDLRMVRRSGLDTRRWAEQTRLKLVEKVAEITRHDAPASTLPADLYAWETHILQMIRNYMIRVADVEKRLKTFNPPLTTDQLRPFRDAIEEDRQTTIDALEPVNRLIETLARWKNAHAALPHS